MRAYTPTSSDDDLGYFDLVVKVYFANEHASFPLVSGEWEQCNRQSTIDLVLSVYLSHDSRHTMLAPIKGLRLRTRPICAHALESLHHFCACCSAISVKCFCTVAAMLRVVSTLCTSTVPNPGPRRGRAGACRSTWRG